MEKLIVYDIETTLSTFIMCYHERREGGVKGHFEISDRKNDLWNMVKYMDSHKNDYRWVGFNNLAFDAQVIEHIIKEHQKWHDYKNEEIVWTIYDAAQDAIMMSNGGERYKYNVNYLTLKQLDLYKIWHYDNDARRTSLKWLMYSLDMEDIEEMPIPHNQPTMTDEEKDLTIKYCYNDIATTSRFLDISFGLTDHPLYSGKDIISRREDIGKRMGIDCLNMSDVKIGDEINKITYCRNKSIPISNLYGMRGFFRKNLKLSQCIPSHINFENQTLIDIHKDLLGKEINKLKGEFKYKFELDGVKYTMMQGGLHSDDPSRIVIPGPNQVIKDRDVN